MDPAQILHPESTRLRQACYLCDISRLLGSHGLQQHCEKGLPSGLHKRMATSAEARFLDVVCLEVTKNIKLSCADASLVLKADTLVSEQVNTMP